MPSSGAASRRSRRMPAWPASAKPAPAARPAPQPAGTEEEMKLTYVVLGKRMDANSKTNTAYFWEDVRVLNLPCDKPTQEIDLEAALAEMPKGSMYLRCDRL